MSGGRPPMGGWDAVVVGGGHNALVAAAYLARGGLRTLVLERRERLGGAADTANLARHIRVPVLAHTVGRLRPSIQRDLGLSRHGLSLVAPDVRVFAPNPEGGAVVLWSDAQQTASGLWARAAEAGTDGARASAARDADAYLAFDRRVRDLGRFLDQLGREVPPDTASPGLDDAIAALRLGRSFRGLGRDGTRTLLRVLPMAVADLVGEAFEDDGLRAALAWRGVRYGAVGPWSAGTATTLLTDGAGNDGGAAGETVFARGGPGALSTALADAARAVGVEIRTEAEVAAITSRDGVATGVVLAGGEEITARAVVSGLDPKRTLLGLLDEVALGPSLAWRAGNIRTPGVTAKVNLAVRRLPRFAAAGDDERVLRGRILVAPGIDAMERAFDASKYGRWSERPIIEATIPSLVDPSLVEGARSGTHVVSVIAQYAPYALRGRDWEADREAFGDAVVEVLESVAPGIGSLVSHRQVLLPADLERDYGLTGGHPLHAEAALDQWFLWRPLLGHARYRIALERLYLCGSGAHPGGGVTGGPGQNAAREVLADLRRR
ncbi:MAG TPA: NAD(P)/FAD-dependent oxidoreductase [Candidatus Deferrimicrobiaceae bacterium]|nr:NAD(P)/FAD-dependent oxidoreductase [Candidatus Deferrimicrobiaceae bacterium]